MEFSVIVKKISNLDGFAFEAFCNRIFLKKFNDYYSTRPHKDGGIDGVIVKDHHIFSMTTEKDLKGKAARDIERVLQEHKDFIKVWTFVTNKNFDDKMLTVVLPAMRVKYSNINIHFMGLNALASIATEVKYDNQTELQSIYGVIDDLYLGIFQSFFRHESKGIAKYNPLYVINYICLLHNEELDRGVVNPHIWKNRINCFPDEFMFVDSISGVIYSKEFLLKFFDHEISQLKDDTFFDFHSRYDQFLLENNFSLLYTDDDNNYKMMNPSIIEVW
ncbi:restriction endonuclease [Paenibacillus periandrae]|uniref:restriction endonuclease n=1 Tax=Paenibacillus periandrae TaxID=1761741 RepID=UPI001F0A0210|nr:restriction endonuclease [Paenibacillus periandrae]